MFKYAICFFFYWQSHRICIFYSFTKFRLEADYDEEASEEERCPDDYVNVFDESDLKTNNSRGLGKFCGNLDDKLPEIKSKTNTVYVNFVSDATVNDEGFVGEISFTYGNYYLF